MMNKNSVMAELSAMAEIYGRNISETAALLILNELSDYKREEISMALSRCRKELNRFPTVVDIIERIDDGRPGVEQAWAMIPKSEDDAVCWTSEMADAYCEVRVLHQIDQVAARQAFKEIYPKLVREARDKRQPVKWVVSQGLDKSHTNSVLQIAYDSGKISFEEAKALDHNFGDANTKQIGFNSEVKKLIDQFQK